MHAQVFEGQQEARAVIERHFQHARAGPELDFGWALCIVMGG